jgi:3-O-methylgallate 3,4-dioxygenase
MLSTPWEKWDERVGADRQNPDLRFRGGSFTFDQLVEERRGENLGREVTPELWRARHQACQTAIATLARKFEDTAPDAVVILGNDQNELFTEENVPAFSVFWGDTIENRPRTAEQTANLPPGVAIAERGHAPPEDAVYPGHPAFGRHIIESLMADEFDVGQSAKIPKGSGYVNGVSHAFGFIYRRIMNDRVIPNVPVNLNTFYPPNQPSAERCYKFGKAVGRAIQSWDGDETVAVIASGGLSHFVIDETIDRPVLDALKTNNPDGLFAIPEDHYQSGTSEIKNWIPLSAIMAESGLEMNLLDYVPCYRSEAGTGNAMGFAIWE